MIDTTIICEHTEFNQDCTPCRAKELMAESNCKDCTCGCCVWPFGEVVESCQCAPCLDHRKRNQEQKESDERFQERKRVERESREAMDERMRQHLAKVGRNDQLDAGDKTAKRTVKRQEIHDKQRHSEQENRRMDRVDARYAEGESSTVDGGLTLADFTQEVTLLDSERLPPALTRTDGATLLYEGRFNTLTAETAQGKSWLALMVAIERLRAGRNVFWWDFEDRATTLATRLQKLNGTHLIGTPELKWATGELTEYPIALAEALIHLDGGNGPGLIVIDSAGSGGCPSDGADVAPWMLANIKPWLNAGHTILLLDHVPKQKKDRPRGGIGSIAKLRDIDGAALYAEGKVWNSSQDGWIHLYNHKDRNGNLPGQLLDCVATVFGEHDGPVIRYTIDLPNAKGQEEDLQDELLDVITHAGATGITGSRSMRDSLKGKRARDVDAAREELLQQGLIERRKVGRAFNYSSTEI